MKERIMRLSFVNEFKEMRHDIKVGKLKLDYKKIRRLLNVVCMLLDIILIVVLINYLISINMYGINLVTKNILGILRFFSFYAIFRIIITTYLMHFN